MKSEIKWPYDEFWYAPMDVDPNEYVLLSFDTGAAATGWFMAGVHVAAFARPSEKILRHLTFWDCGEISGTETEILTGCVKLIDWCVTHAKSAARRVPPVPALHIMTEDFDLTQLKGGKYNLLSPVRQNAVLAWECHKRGIELKYQKRNLRLSVTADRLEAYGFEGPWRTSGKGKDQFAATQHGVVWLRSLKKASIGHPWRVQK